MAMAGVKRIQSISKKRRLFLLAAPSCAGKSTLLRIGFEQVASFFDDELKQSFLETNLDITRNEYEKFIDAVNHNSYFNAVHIPDLKNIDLHRQSLLLHLDLYNILKKLAPNAYASRTAEENKPIGSQRHIVVQFIQKSFNRAIGRRNRWLRRDKDLLNREPNDFLMKQYLSDSFFRTFDEVVVITLHCPYERNQEQLLKRTGRRKFGYPRKWASLVHSELYNCWRRNIKILNPILAINVIYEDGKYKILLEDKNHYINSLRA